MRDVTRGAWACCPVGRAMFAVMVLPDGAARGRGGGPLPLSGLEGVEMRQDVMAFGVGLQIAEESELLSCVRSEMQLTVFLSPQGVYQRLPSLMPDFVIFSADGAETGILRLYRQLARVGRVCVIVVDEADMTAYRGKGYRWSMSAAKSAAGMRTLLEWGLRSRGFIGIHD
ncbi:MAG: hypothetical protein KGS47_03470 [Chloroflexi bacterium]|nr:hypothetical protein [Chloroflexota bacterium]